jgi:hypothetical protein
MFPHRHIASGYHNETRWARAIQPACYIGSQLAYGSELPECISDRVIFQYERRTASVDEPVERDGGGHGYRTPRYAGAYV